MQKSFPTHITNERDLDIYKEYLENDSGRNLQKNRPITEIITPKKPNGLQNVNNTSVALSGGMFFQGYLKNHVGKLVRVESLIGGCLDTRVGILFDVGANYIVLKLNRSSCSMMIETSSIKYVTIIHDNDINKANIY